MNPSLEQTLVEVWRQVHVENADAAELGTERYPVRRTPQTRFTAGGFRFRWERDSWAGAEP